MTTSFYKGSQTTRYQRALQQLNSVRPTMWYSMFKFSITHFLFTMQCPPWVGGPNKIWKLHQKIGNSESILYVKVSRQIFSLSTNTIYWPTHVLAHMLQSKADQLAVQTNPNCTMFMKKLTTGFLHSNRESHIVVWTLPCFTPQLLMQ